MTCQDLVRRLSDDIDGTLSPEARAEAEAHLDAPRREALLRRLEKACRGGDNPV